MQNFKQFERLLIPVCENIHRGTVWLMCIPGYRRLRGGVFIWWSFQATSGTGSTEQKIFYEIM